MWFAPMLKLRDKLARKRNILLEDEEKPFLEHLDDLRKMLMRIVITLLVSITLCFVFNKWFFEVIQYPMQRAGLASAQERNLPEGIDLEQWKQVHTAARGASVLQGEGRELFLSKAVPYPKLRAYAEAMLIYHTADMLPPDQQGPYLEEAARLLPAPMQTPVAEAGRAILKARPQSSLEALRPVIETEAFAPAETFMLSMKLSMFAGIIVSFPLLFYFILEFVLPGLNPRERKLLWPALAIGFGLFLLGVFFAYYFVIPNALEFFHEYSRELGIRDGWRIGNYISFVVSFCLIFGVSFELPVIVMILVKLELLTSATMRRTRSWAIVIITVASAILTPTGDIFTLSLLAGPMIIMYEICIWLALALERKNARMEAEEAQRDMARRAALVGVASVAAARPGSSEAAPGVGGDDDSHHGPDGEDDPYHHHHHDDAWHHDHDHDSHGDSSHEVSDPHHGDTTWEGHPHHPDPDLPTADEEYAQYMREHAHLFPPAQTHPEEVPLDPDSTNSPSDPVAPEDSATQAEAATGQAVPDEAATREEVPDAEPLPPDGASKGPATGESPQPGS
jgi:sec-independent protein translocase protein TatC